MKSKRRKILIIKFPYSSTYGGGEKHTFTLVQQLSKDYDFFLLSTCSVLVPEFQKRGWSVETTWAGTEPVTPKAVVWFLMTWPAILANLLSKLLYYKIVHHIDAIFCLSLTEKILLTPFARLLGIKIFWMEHLQIERWLLANPLRPFYVLWSHLATVVTVVEAVKDQLIKLGVRPQRIVVIYNAIDVKAFTPHPSRPEELAEHFHVLFIGRLATEKGIDDLLQAVATVHKTISQVTLTLVGEGPARAELEQLTASLKLQSIVRFIGFQQNVTAWVQACDVLVLASTRRETFGIVIIEALATNKPVIATTTGGLTEIVDRYGWLVPPHRPAAIAEALIDVYNNYELALHKTSRGRIRVLELFQERRMIQEYDSLFRKP